MNKGNVAMVLCSAVCGGAIVATVGVIYLYWKLKDIYR